MFPLACSLDRTASLSGEIASDEESLAPGAFAVAGCDDLAVRLDDHRLPRAQPNPVSRAALGPHEDEERPRGHDEY